MHWEILIIPLIALGVWILGTLFKGGEDERFKKLGRRPGGAVGRMPARRPVTDLDRFLEEARQRREAEQPIPPQPPPPPPARAAAPRPSLRERPPQPRETPARPASQVNRREEAPVARPSRAEPVLAEPVPAAEATPATAPIVARATRPSPAVQQVRSLLSQPQTAGTAFVLREVFGPPKCRQRR